MTYISPGGAPVSPACPAPGTRRRLPVSTPAGILIFFRTVLSTRPWPRQLGHGSVTTVPVPLQWGHALTCIILPSRVFCITLIWPLPWQLEHWLRDVPALAPVPLHSSQAVRTRTEISLSVPNTASSKDRERSTPTSAPFFGCWRLLERPPKASPNIDSKISSKFTPKPPP